MCNRTITQVWIGCVALILTSCATTRDVKAPVISGESVTGEDIWISGGSSALDGARLLRHDGMLRGPGREPPVVYLDGIRLATLESLWSLHFTAVKSMRYLDAPTATIRYGTGHTGGAIVVATHRGR